MEFAGRQIRWYWKDFYFSGIIYDVYQCTKGDILTVIKHQPNMSAQANGTINMSPWSSTFQVLPSFVEALRKDGKAISVPAQRASVTPTNQCTCDIQCLMAIGCKCGQMKREKQRRT